MCNYRIWMLTMYRMRGNTRKKNFRDAKCNRVQSFLKVKRTIFLSLGHATEKLTQGRKDAKNFSFNSNHPCNLALLHFYHWLRNGFDGLINRWQVVGLFFVIDELKGAMSQRWIDKKSLCPCNLALKNWAGYNPCRYRGAHWCSRLTRSPLKAETTGSSPVCAARIV